MDVHAAAIGHFVETSRLHGVAPDVLAFLKGLLDRAVALGYGHSGIAGVTEVIKQPVAQAATPAS